MSAPPSAPSGVEPVPYIAPNLVPNAEYDAEVPLADREEKWGFSLEELRAANKVVRVLFLDPTLYVDDPYLADSRLYTMITRDSITRRKFIDALRIVANQEKSRRKRFVRKQNIAAMDSTIMRREREDTLNLLMLLDRQGGSPTLRIADKDANDESDKEKEKEKEEDTENVAAAAAAPDAGKRPREDTTDEAGTAASGGDLSEPEKAHLRLIGAFENLLRLERCLALREHYESTYCTLSPSQRAKAAGPAAVPIMATGHAAPQSTGGVDWTSATQLTAQVYRYVPHAFGSQMPPPLFPGPVPADLTERQRASYIRGVKVQLALRAAELIPLPRCKEEAMSDGAAQGKRPRVDPVCPSSSCLSAAVRGAGIVDADVAVVSPAAALDAATADWMMDAFTRIDALRALVTGGHGVATSTEEPAPFPATNAAAAAAAVFDSVVVKPVDSTESLLRALDALLVTGGPADATVFGLVDAASQRATAEGLAECSLNVFLARRLYSNAKLAAYGPSPVVVDRVAPVCESEEPDEWNIFEDVQLFAADHRDHNALKVIGWRGCYICKVRYNQLHPYYYSMCHLCAEFNYNKRLMARDLRGKVVLLTGCRIKIGFAMAVSLLRCGAVVLGTTRFAHEAVARFQQESDYDEWKHNLHLYSLDLRDLWVVTQFCAFVGQRFLKVFAIVNNAAQTIARTPQYTEHLRRIEMEPAAPLRAVIEADPSAAEWHRFFLHHTTVSIGQPLSIEPHVPTAVPFLPITEATDAAPEVIPDKEGEGEVEEEERSAPTTDAHSTAPAVRPTGLIETHGPEGTTLVFDRYDRQVENADHRDANSWVTKLAEVQGSEAAEVMAINALAPFILNSKLKPCLTNRAGDATPNEARFIINVSAMEGQFYRFKQATHPHTNMAKAALNMMTRTSASDYAEDGIYMNSVDTGWITDEGPKEMRDRREKQMQQCPIDEVDAAARCLDLMYVDSPVYGLFYKDFKSIPW